MPTADIAPIVHFVRDALREVFGDESIPIDYPLLEYGALDSLTLMDLVSFLEAEYSIALGPSDLVGINFATIHAIHRMVSAKVDGRV